MLPRGLPLVVLLLAVSLFTFSSDVQAGGGELVITGDQQVLIKDIRYVQTGDVVIKDNGALILENAVLQLSLRGEKPYRITLRDNGKLILRQSNITALASGSTITLFNTTELTGFNFAITGLEGGDISIRASRNSTVSFGGSTRGASLVRVQMLNILSKRFTLTNTTVEGGLLGVPSAGLFAAGGAFISPLIELSVDQFKADDTTVKGSLAVTSFTFSASNMVVQNELKVTSRSIALFGVKAGVANLTVADKVEIFDSQFGRLHIDKGDARLFNVTVTGGDRKRAGGEVTVANATAVRHWHLIANVTGFNGKPIVGAKAQVLELFNDTVIAETVTGNDGLARLMVLAEFVSGRGYLFIGNYRLRTLFRDLPAKMFPVTLDFNRLVQVVYDEYPLQSSISLNVRAQTITQGDSIVVTGQLSPALEGQRVTLLYRSPDGKTIERSAVVQADGRFSDTFTLGATGKWTVRSEWPGGGDYAGSQSDTLTFTVQERFPILLLPVILVAVVGAGVALFLFHRRRATKFLVPPPSPPTKVY